MHSVTKIQLQTVEFLQGMFDHRTVEIKKFKKITAKRKQKSSHGVCIWLTPAVSEVSVQIDTDASFIDTTAILPPHTVLSIRPSVTVRIQVRDDDPIDISQKFR